MNKQLTQIRIKLDKIDLKILKLIKSRQLLVNQVIKTKKSKNKIIDKKRIRQILIKIKKNSKRIGVNTVVAEKIWKQMINAFIAYEYKYFKKYRK